MLQICVLFRFQLSLVNAVFAILISPGRNQRDEAHLPVVSEKELSLTF